MAASSSRIRSSLLVARSQLSRAIVDLETGNIDEAHRHAATVELFAREAKELLAVLAREGKEQLDAALDATMVDVGGKDE